MIQEQFADHVPPDGHGEVFEVYRIPVLVRIIDQHLSRGRQGRSDLRRHVGDEDQGALTLSPSEARREQREQG
ncbi:MAG: hypothetical protein CMK00_00405 [Planctomycetes bacterium]|nr:hypothetical protein [Planctomycetota bacterium]